MSVIIITPKGIHCPNPSCKSQDVTSVGRYRPLPQLRIRYFRCNACKCRFKSEERVKGILPKKG